MPVPRAVFDATTRRANVVSEMSPENPLLFPDRITSPTREPPAGRPVRAFPPPPILIAATPERLPLNSTLPPVAAIKKLVPTPAVRLMARFPEKTEALAVAPPIITSPVKASAAPSAVPAMTTFRPTVKPPSVTNIDGNAPLAWSPTRMVLVALPSAPAAPDGALPPTNRPPGPTRTWPVKELAVLLNRILLPLLPPPPIATTGADPEITPVQRAVPLLAAFKNTLAPSEFSTLSPENLTSRASKVPIVTAFAPVVAPTLKPRANVPLPKAVTIRVVVTPESVSWIAEVPVPRALALPARSKFSCPTATETGPLNVLAVFDNRNAKPPVLTIPPVPVMRPAHTVCALAALTVIVRSSVSVPERRAAVPLRVSVADPAPASAKRTLRLRLAPVPISSSTFQLLARVAALPTSTSLVALPRAPATPGAAEIPALAAVAVGLRPTNKTPRSTIVEPV